VEEEDFNVLPAVPNKKKKKIEKSKKSNSSLDWMIKQHVISYRSERFDWMSNTI
jgi:hypothetical protein